jgi:hypothetical protein
LGCSRPEIRKTLYVAAPGARQMDRRDGEPERLRALVNGDEWHPVGTREQPELAPARRESDDQPVNSGIQGA